MTVDVLAIDWPAPSRVRAFVTTRRGGVSHAPYGSHDGTANGLNLGDHVGDDPRAVTENRRRLPLAVAPRWLRQVHGTTVLDLDVASSPESGAAEADASITARADRACAVLVADCMPVLFADVRGRAVGAAHAGWRGLAAGVLERTIDALRARVPDGEWLAWIGPCIGPARFEIGPEVRAALLATDTGAHDAGVFARGAGDRWFADLPLLAARRLRACGVRWVGRSGLCVVGEPERFYSFRRDGTTGRFAGVVALVGD